MTNPFTLTKEQYQELYKEVLLFSQIGGVVADENNLWKMCEEEFIEELGEAVAAGDRLAIIDAIADSFVVLAQLHNYYRSKPTWEQSYLASFNFNPKGGILNKSEAFAEDCTSWWYYQAVELAEEYNFNLYKAIKEVNRSNMTKYPTATKIREYYGDVGECLHLAAMECMELSNGKYKDVVAFWNPCTGSDLVVFRADRGKSKIVKHLAFYEEPNFEDCWV